MTTPVVFSTAGLPAVRRVALWEEHNAAALVALSCRTTRPLAATEVNVRLDRLRLARVTGSAHAVARTRAVIGIQPADAVAVYVSLRGTASFEHDGGTHALRPGTVLLCDTDRPFLRGFAHGLEELAVTVPRSVVGRTARAPVLTDLADPHARALAGLVGRATRPDHPVTADERVLRELVTLLAGGDIDPAVSHRAAATAFIEEHLSDQGLSAPVVATAVGISERHLSRVFAAAGTSVPRHILSRRLHLAHSMLTSTGLPVADVARRCGFTSATHFSHVFRGHFGVRAGELRISAIPAANASRHAPRA